MPPQGLGVLLTRGEHDLVMPDVPGQGVVGDLDTVLVPQLGLDLGNRPVTCKATMADPTKHVPSDRPLGQRDGDFKFRAFRPGVTRAAWVGAVVELADQLDRTIKHMDSAVPMVTHIHHASAERALTVEDIKFPESEIRILGPGIRHPAHLHPVTRSIDVAAR